MNLPQWRRILYGQDVSEIPTSKPLTKTVNRIGEGAENLTVEKFMITERFVHAWNERQEQAYHTACEKGWYDEPVSFAEQIALIHSELSEALEAARDGDPPSEKIPGFSCREEELADAVIRLASLSQDAGLRVGAAIVAKMEYNKGRSHRHGGKLF